MRAHPPRLGYEAHSIKPTSFPITTTILRRITPGVGRLDRGELAMKARMIEIERAKERRQGSDAPSEDSLIRITRV